MIRKIKNIIFRIIYIFIIIYLLIFFPKIFGYKPLVIISGSMEPILKVGGILYYHNENLNEFQKGDILVYKTPEHIISHRIVKINKDSFITRGDANQIDDLDVVKQDQVLGKGTNWSIPYIGYYADYIYHHKYLIFISLTVIIFDIGIDFYKKKVGLDNEK